MPRGPYPSQDDDTSEVQTAPAPPAPATPSGPMSNGNVIGSDAYWTDVENRLKSEAGSRGLAYDASDLEGIKRNASNNNGTGLAGAGAALANQLSIYDKRAQPNAPRLVDSQSAQGNALYGSGSGNASNTATINPATWAAGARGATTATPQSNGAAVPGNQFTDPYTNLLEDLAKNALARYNQPNDQVTQLLSYIQGQFDKLSQGNGYTPQEQAVLNTQAFEPIEALRKQSQQNVLQRASLRGIMPSSGVVQDEAAQVDRASDQSRTAANRDLAINQINRQTQQQGQALDLAKLLVDIPDQRSAQTLNIGNLLYQLPRTAMQDALGIVNATGAPTSSISSILQLLQQSQQPSGMDAFFEWLGQNARNM